MKKTLITSLFILAFLWTSYSARAAEVLVEAESFSSKGGWSVDQQFMDLMGSPYLLAHGMGSPVNDARTKVSFPKTGTYYAYVRTFNWTSPWHKGEGPGKFRLSVNGKEIDVTLGAQGNEWRWQRVGKITVSSKEVEIGLRDLSGFDGRCDALYFSTVDTAPTNDPKALAAWRKKLLGLPAQAPLQGSYDLVVVGGGIAGMSAAISAARLGCKVALLNDRPVLGGNNSSEIRVHLGGAIGEGPYPELGGLQKEWGPLKGGNAKPAANYEDEKKDKAIAAEKNITLLSNYRATQVVMEGKLIKAVIAQHIESGKEIRVEAPLFADCTGDGTVGFLAGADYTMGREARSMYNEPTAPEEGDKMTMGASVQWYSEVQDSPTVFPIFRYGLDFNEKSAEKVTMGEWTWETGMNFDQINDFERIRDYGLMVVYSNWSFLKNDMVENDAYKNRSLGWVAYVAGKRESRRLMGDVVLTENDIKSEQPMKDATGATTWTIDLHYPDPKNTAHFPGAEFKSIAKHMPIKPYPIPYRCLYSRTVGNLFMAGRNISVSHVALGTVRVMRTTGIMGEVVGMAASICKKHGSMPRSVYTNYFDELKELMKAGIGGQGLPNNQLYNGGVVKK